MKSLNDHEMAKVEGGGPVAALLTLLYTGDPFLALVALFAPTV